MARRIALVIAALLTAVCSTPVQSVPAVDASNRNPLPPLPPRIECYPERVGSTLRSEDCKVAALRFDQDFVEPSFRISHGHDVPPEYKNRFVIAPFTTQHGTCLFTVEFLNREDHFISLRAFLLYDGDKPDKGITDQCVGAGKGNGGIWREWHGYKAPPWFAMVSEVGFPPAKSLLPKRVSPPSPLPQDPFDPERCGTVLGQDGVVNAVNTSAVCGSYDGSHWESVPSEGDVAEEVSPVEVD